jgi:hypothetical protein
MTSHHGDGSAGSQQMIHAMHPRVAIMNNGPERAGQSFANIRSSPGLQDIWQLHTTIKAADRNPPADFIANRPEDTDGKWIEVSAQKDGTFTVRNQRNQFEKTYKK